MKRFAFVIGIFSLVSAFAFSQTKIAYSGDSSYKLVERTNLRRYVNGKYSGLTSREVRSFISRSEAPAGARSSNLDRWYDGNFFVMEETLRNSQTTMAGIHDAIPSVFKISPDGKMTMTLDNGYPTFRSFPSYTTEKLTVGDSWKGEGERAVDPMNKGVFTRIPILVLYTFEGAETYKGEQVYRIKAIWQTNYGFSNFDRDPKGDDLLKQATGGHKADIIVRAATGEAILISDNVDETFTYADGTQVNLKGTISMFTEYPPAIDHDKLIFALNRIAKADDSPKSGSGAASGKAGGGTSTASGSSTVGGGSAVASTKGTADSGSRGSLGGSSGAIASTKGSGGASGSQNSAGGAKTQVGGSQNSAGGTKTQVGGGQNSTETAKTQVGGDGNSSGGTKAQIGGGQNFSGGAKTQIGGGGNSTGGAKTQIGGGQNFSGKQNGKSAEAKIAVGDKKSGGGDSDSKSNMVFEETPAGIRLSVRDIRFKADSDEVLATEKSRLDEIAEVLKLAPGSQFLIEGHTAAVGKPQGEQTLSEQRARRIAAELSKRGIAADRFICKGHGGNKPIASNATDAGRAQNRRVEITILE